MHKSMSIDEFTECKDDEKLKATQELIFSDDVTFLQ